jgi:hypothetical protein
VPRSLATDRVWSAFEDRSKVLWAGTYGGGLNTLDLGRKRFLHVRHDPRDPASLGHDIVWSFHEDGDGTLWVGTDSAGLQRWDRRKNVFRGYLHDPRDAASLSHDTVRAMLGDAAGNLWVATNGGGLDRFDRTEDRFTRFTAAQGLSSDAVYGIFEDERGRLWVSTNRGLTELDPGEGTFHAWDVRDGLQSDEFNGGAYYRSDRGEMFFGGIGGFNAFFPSEIAARTGPAPVVLTELLLANRPVPVCEAVRGRTILRRFVGYEEEVVLSHEDDVVSREFAALHFSAPRKIRYFYRLDGFDRDWIPAGADQRVATYTGLPPGAYLFHVKTANPDGVWAEEETRLRIVVTPPFWGTWWFRLAAVLLRADRGPRRGRWRRSRRGRRLPGGSRRR